MEYNPERNYKRKLSELKGIEIIQDQYLISTEVLGTRHLHDGCGVIIENGSEAGLAHVASRGHQPERNLKRLIEQFLEENTPIKLKATIISGCCREHERIFEYLNSQKIKTNLHQRLGTTNKYLLYIPKEKRVEVYTGLKPQGIEIEL
jgi:hypothetical protein